MSSDVQQSILVGVLRLSVQVSQGAYETHIGQSHVQAFCRYRSSFSCAAAKSGAAVMCECTGDE